jgi:hypothetical protein
MSLRGPYNLRLERLTCNLPFDPQFNAAETLQVMPQNHNGHHNGEKYGEEGQNTPPAPGADLAKTIIAPDGFNMVAPDEMYRMNELQPGRREPGFHNLHNLHDSVFERTLHPVLPLPLDKPDIQRRATLWDNAANSVREALSEIPSGTHVVVCSNSGPYSPKLEPLPPWNSVDGATVGLLLVAEFRDEAKEEKVHPAWRQVAVPINSNEGRLFAGLRLLPAVTGRNDLTFTITNLTHPSVAPDQMNIVKDAPELRYGCVANSWKPTNLGGFYHPGCLFAAEYDIFRASFAYDGDLYGWDEAMVYTRKPVAVITDKSPARRFHYWYDKTVLRDVTWLQMVDGRLRGGYQESTTRADVVEWDKNGIPGGFVDGAV